MSETDDTDSGDRWRNPLARETPNDGAGIDDPADDPGPETETDDSSQTWNPVAWLREYFSEDLPPGTLLDGTEALFVDPAATARHLDEYRLVVLVNDAYPEPAVLYASADVLLPEDAVFVTAGPSTLAQVGDRRVLVRDYALADADRAATVDPDRRRDLPDDLAGATVTARDCQHYDLYDALVGAADKARRSA
jgi:hypothetical protein